MKKNERAQRILGRRLATEMTREQLLAAQGSVASSDSKFDGGVSTWTLTYPADGPYNDNSGGGGTVVA